MAKPTLAAEKAGTKRAKPASVCTTPGCGKPATHRRQTLCYACHTRLKRKGTVAYHVPQQRVIHPSGYIMVRAEGHPLALKGRAYVAEHRVVFHAHYGQGPFVCHWCGIGVTWETMHVDHVNEDRTDNDISNLVAACPRCNQWRNPEKNVAALRAKVGKMISAFGRTMCVSEWAREVGIKPFALEGRLKRGWPVERALSERRGASGRPNGRERKAS